ncbi:hypothetical protein FOA52_001350 [Chlamydomonas sp. UWO 241]|nr:hypothetical protein FOA52_001350 [Chlamydomonas sp. UWO 241]
MASGEAAPNEFGVVERVEGSIAEVFGDAQMPFKVLMRCKVDGKAQQGEQEVVVSRPKDGGGRLAMKIMEPMLSLVKRHKLRMCTLDRVTNAALPVLTMVMVTRATGTAAHHGCSPPLLTTAASLRSQGHAYALWLKDPMLSLMRGRRTLSWSLAPAQGGVGSLPEMTVELGDYFTRRRLPPASQSLPIQPTTRVTGSGSHTASDFSDGSSSGDEEQAHGLRGRKRSAIAAATNAAAAAAETPPAKKGRSQGHGQQLPSGDAKDAQKRKVASSFRGVMLNGKNWAATLYDRDARSHLVHLGSFGSEEEAARSYDRASIVSRGAEAKTNFPLTDYAQELSQLKKMTREEVVAHVRRGSSGFTKGVRQEKSGRWDAQANKGGRHTYLGMYDTEEDAARVFDFAVLLVRGKQAITNFDKGAYLGAGGALLPVETALPELGRDQHRLVRDKLAGAMVGAGSAAEGAAEAKKGRSQAHGNQLPSGAAKVTQKRKPPAKIKSSNGGVVTESKYHGVTRSGRRWKACAHVGSRWVYLGTYVTGEVAARVWDFAVLSLRGVDTQTATNFDKGAYLGADGALLSVEAALPGLERDQHRVVRDKLAAAGVDLAGAAGGGSDGGANSGSSSDSDSASGGADPGTAALVPPKAGQTVKRVEGSLAELLVDVQMPHKVLLQCSVDSQLQPGTQQVLVSRLEDGSGRLAMKVMEPMLSLIKRHTLRTCTLDRDTNAALPVLTMVLAQGMRARKRSAADANAPPAKKGRSQVSGQLLPSGAAKAAQKRKAPKEPPEKTKSLNGGGRADQFKYHGVSLTKTGRWETRAQGGNRRLCLGTYATDEGAARVYDFAALSLRGVDTQTAINFNKAAYLGANGALLPVEAALPGLGSDQHRHVRDKLAAARVGAGGAAEGAPDSGSDSDSGGSSGNESESDTGSSDPAGSTRVRTRAGAAAPGTAAVGAVPPVRLCAGAGRHLVTARPAGTARRKARGRRARRRQAQLRLPPVLPAKYHGVYQNTSGRWRTYAWGDGRQFNLGSYGTGEDAARVSNFAVLSLRGVDTQTAINFNKGAYLAADSTLLPVEAALQGLRRDQHRLVRDELAAVGVGAGGVVDGGSDGGADSGSNSDRDRAGGGADPGTAAVGTRSPVHRRGPASGGAAPSRHGQARGAQPDTLSPRPTRTFQQQAQQQLPPVPPTKYRGVSHARSGRWEARASAVNIRQFNLGTYDTSDDAARVFDFAVLSLRGVDTQAVINFDKAAYLGANGALLLVEAALPGLGRDKHRLVRNKLAAAGVGAAGAAEEGSDGGADSDSSSDCDSGGSAEPGTAAVGTRPSARSRGPASADVKPGGAISPVAAASAPAAAPSQVQTPRGRTKPGPDCQWLHTNGPCEPRLPLPLVPQKQLPPAPAPHQQPIQATHAQHAQSPPPLLHQPLPLVPPPPLPPPPQAQQPPSSAPLPPLPHQPLIQVSRQQQAEQQLPLAPPPLHQPLIQMPPQPQQEQQPPAPPPAPPAPPPAPPAPPAPQAHEFMPAVGSVNDFNTRAAALAFLRELYAASNEGTLPLGVYQVRHAQAMAALQIQ